MRILVVVDPGGGGGSTPNPPGKATPTAPANNKTCETGTSVSDTQSSVTFLGTVLPIQKVMI